VNGLVLLVGWENERRKEKLMASSTGRLTATWKERQSARELAKCVQKKADMNTVVRS